MRILFAFLLSMSIGVQALSASRDYYDTLELPQRKKALPSAIKENYHRLARMYHPDVNHESEAEERFKELGEAYEVLSDPEERAAYDSNLHDPVEFAARRKSAKAAAPIVRDPLGIMTRNNDDLADLHDWYQEYRQAGMSAREAIFAAVTHYRRRSPKPWGLTVRETIRIRLGRAPRRPQPLQDENLERRET